MVFVNFSCISWTFSHDRGKAKTTTIRFLTKKLKSQCNRVRHRENVPSILGFKPDPRESWFENAIPDRAAINQRNRLSILYRSISFFDVYWIGKRRNPGRQVPIIYLVYLLRRLFFYITYTLNTKNFVIKSRLMIQCLNGKFVQRISYKVLIPQNRKSTIDAYLWQRIGPLVLSCFVDRRDDELVKRVLRALNTLHSYRLPMLSIVWSRTT